MPKECQQDDSLVQSARWSSRESSLVPITHTTFCLILWCWGSNSGSPEFYHWVTLRTLSTHMGWLRSRSRPSDSFWSLSNHTYTSHTHKQNTNRCIRILNAKGLFCNKFLEMRDHHYTSLLLSTLLCKPWFCAGDSQLIYHQNCMASLVSHMDNKSSIC